MRNRLGMHMRVNASLMQVLEKAALLNVPFFQCFLIQQETGALITLPVSHMRSFVQIRREKFTSIFCHGSYWINLASLGNNGYQSLTRELVLAKKLEFSHFILHPGVAKGAKEKGQGIDALAFCLNALMKKESEIMFVLENTSHGKLTIGSDIVDFKHLLEKLDMPERIGFCIDTAHAHSYGYSLIEQEDQETFIDLLDHTIGIERIKVIHLNDTHEKRGSRIDRHAVFGQGNIGSDALMCFARNDRLQHIPLILELPELAIEQELEVLKTIRLFNPSASSDRTYK